MENERILQESMQAEVIGIVTRKLDKIMESFDVTQKLAVANVEK